MSDQRECAESAGTLENTGLQDDAILARRAADGCRDALGALFSRHRDAVYRVAFRITGTLHDAEDVLQEVFVGLPRALSRYEERGRFSSWLKRVAARVALSRVRARSRHPFEMLDLNVPQAADLRASPDRVIDRLTLQGALGALPGSQRIVFLLKEVEGFSHGEIADLLGISEVSSRVRLHRAWGALHDRLGGVGG